MCQIAKALCQLKLLWKFHSMDQNICLNRHTTRTVYRSKEGQIMLSFSNKISQPMIGMCQIHPSYQYSKNCVTRVLLLLFFYVAAMPFVPSQTLIYYHIWYSYRCFFWQLCIINQPPHVLLLWHDSSFSPKIHVYLQTARYRIFEDDVENDQEEEIFFFVYPHFANSMLLNKTLLSSTSTNTSFCRSNGAVAWYLKSYYLIEFFDFFLLSF